VTDDSLSPRQRLIAYDNALCKEMFAKIRVLQLEIRRLSSISDEQYDIEQIEANARLDQVLGVHRSRFPL
jgi:hypothetical protein